MGHPVFKIKLYEKWIKKYEEKQAATEDVQKLERYKETIEIYRGMIKIEEKSLDNWINNNVL